MANLKATKKVYTTRATITIPSLSRAAAFCLALLLFLTAAKATGQTIKLEGGWQFLADREGALKPDELGSARRDWRSVRVGLSWNAQFADLRDYMGVAWYRTSFEAPGLAGGRRALLKFGAVDYFSEVYVNGKRVGEHEGGYTPFTFDVTEALKPGANSLIVRVLDPPMDEQEGRRRFPQMLYKEIPHGKQNWYVQTGGIWQPVTLEIRPPVYIERVRVSPRSNGEVNINVGLSAGGKPVGMFNQGLTVTVRNPRGEVEFKQTLRARDMALHSFKGRVNAPQLWSPSHPSLYAVEVKLEGNAPDVVHDRFGFRSFEARDGRFYLNGEPFYMISALDQDFYPETIYSSPAEDYVRDQMLKAKRLGLNMLRCHIKVPDPVYLKVADETGMLVWYEVPSWNDFNHYTAQAAARGEKIFAEMAERDWNHPSIVIQTIINESWGADLKQAEQRQWLRAAYDRAKQLLEPRGILVVDNSACCDNFHLKTDVEDFHQYFSIPDNHALWDRWVADFAARPKWSFSPHGDAQRTGREPLVVSEFGNWGLPKLPAELPWWFDRDFGGREVTRPAGVLERFRDFKFARLFSDYNQLAEATQWHQFKSLKHEIEEIRRHASIQGYVITEFTDINWEANGLMDMWREPKVYAADLQRLQQPDLVVGRARKRNYTSGERVEIETLISHYSETPLTRARVRWSTTSGAGGEFTIPREIARGSVEPLEVISFAAPRVDRPRGEILRLEVRSRGGMAVAENSSEIFIYPEQKRASKAALLLYDPTNSSSTLRQSLQSAGYNVSTDIDESDNQKLLVAALLDEKVERHLRRGGRAVLLLNSKEAFPANAPYKVTPRADSDLNGNWVTNFNWIRSQIQPFSDVAFSKLLGFEAVSAIPRYIIQGVRPEDYEDVLSGIFYGWLNNNAALAVQMKVGDGKLFATTFRFEAYGTDPYATHLLDAIIHYTGGSGFAPRLDWNAKSK